MPKAQSPLELTTAPYPLSADDIVAILHTIKRFYGEDAIVRSYGADAGEIKLHVEANQQLETMEYADCMGSLLCRINCERIHLISTKRRLTTRGYESTGRPKIAYREGVII